MRNPKKNHLNSINPKDLFKERRLIADFNLSAHEQLHRPASLIWTSITAIPTTAGSAMYIPRSCQIVSARLNVQVAPTSLLTWKILKNGVDVFSTDPTIAIGSTYGAITEWVDNAIALKDDYLQFQVSTVGGATGPAIGVIEFIPLDFI